MPVISRCERHHKDFTDEICPDCADEFGEVIPAEGIRYRCDRHHKKYNYPGGCPECNQEMENFFERKKKGFGPDPFNVWGQAQAAVHKESALGDCLDEAKKTICGERQDVYGSPEDSFAIIAKYWSTYLANRQTDLDAPLDSKDVAHMMVLFKMARVQGQKEHRDSYVDICGYAAIAADRLSPQDGATKERIDAYNKKAVAEARDIIGKNAPSTWKDGSPGCPHTRTKFVKTTTGDCRQCLGCGARLEEG